MGSFGDVSYFSFAYGKNMTTFSGGMIVTNNKNLYNSIKEQINFYENNTKDLSVLKGLITYFITNSFFIYQCGLLNWLL